MSKSFTEEIVEVLENSGGAMTAKEIADKLSEMLPKDYSVNPKKVQLRVKENSDLFSVENGRIELTQEKSKKQSIYDKLKYQLSSTISHSSGGNKLTYLVPALLLYKRLRDQNSHEGNESEIPLYNDPSDYFKTLHTYFLKNNLSSHYKSYKYIFKNSLDKIDNDLLFKNLVNDFSDLDLSEERFSNSDFAEIYSQLIDYLGKANKKNFGEFLPDEVFSFISNLISVANVSRVYSPILTSANFFSKVHRELFKNRKDVYFCGHAEGELQYYLTLQNFLSAGHEKFDIYQEDALESDEAKHFDLAISQLPLGRKRPKLKNDPEYLSYGKTTSREWFYVQKMLHSVGKKGRVISIMGGHALSSLVNKKIRSAFLQENIVEAIIKLPKNLFNSASISPYILLLNKDRSNDKIFMADFAQKIDSYRVKQFQKLSDKVSDSYHNHLELDGVTRYLSTKEIFNNNSSLNPANYIHQDLDKVKEFLEGENEKIFSLKEVVKNKVTGRYHLKKDEEIDQDSEWFYYKPVKYISSRDLKKQKNLVDLRFSNLKSIDSSAGYRKSIIDSKAVLVSLFNDLDPIIFVPTEDNPSLVIGKGVLALFPDETKISAEYLQYQLSQETTQVQIELKQGGMVPRTNIRDLFETKIFVPGEKEQRKEVFEFKKSLLDKEESEEQYKQKEKIIMANVRHSLKNQMGPIWNDFKTTKEFLGGLHEEKKNFKWDLPIRPATYDGEKVKSVEQVFERIERKFDELNEILDKMTDIINLSKATLELDFVQIGKFIRRIYDDMGFDSDNTLLKVNGSKLEAPISNFWFREAISNLLINADRHGRIEEQKLELQFDITKTEDGYLRIFYANNGKPLPPNFDFEIQFKGFKEKAGSEEGSGLGGYLINKVIESHGGSIDLIQGDDNEPSYFNVEMEILIPKGI